MYKHKQYLPIHSSIITSKVFLSNALNIIIISKRIESINKVASNLTQKSKMPISLVILMANRFSDSEEICETYPKEWLLPKYRI